MGTRLLPPLWRGDESEKHRRVSLGEMKNFIARRPVYSVLGTEKYERLTGNAPRDWHDAVAEYVTGSLCPVN